MPIIWSGTAIDGNIFVFIGLKSKYRVSNSESQNDVDDDVTIVGHNKHHCQDMHCTIEANIAEIEYSLSLAPKHMLFIGTVSFVFGLRHQQTVLLFCRKQMIHDFCFDGWQNNWEDADNEGDCHG